MSSFLLFGTLILNTTNSEFGFASSHAIRKAYIFPLVMCLIHSSVVLVFVIFLH